MQYACAIRFERIDVPRAGQSQMSSSVAFVEINCDGNKKHYDLLRDNHKDRVPITDGEKSWGKLEHFVVVQFHSSARRYRYAIDARTVQELFAILANHGRDSEHVRASVGSFIAKKVSYQPHRPHDELLIGRSDRPTKHDVGMSWDLDECDNNGEPMQETRLIQQQATTTAAATQAAN